MKIIDLLNIWVEDRSKLPRKIKVRDDIYVYDEIANLYKTQYKDYFLIQDYLACAEKLNSEVEVIEEDKEIEEKLDWEEIIGSVGKPLWDNKRKEWRVLDYYCREKDAFYVSFSDTNHRENFLNQELYFKEIKEESR